MLNFFKSEDQSEKISILQKQPIELLIPAIVANGLLSGNLESLELILQTPSLIEKVKSVYQETVPKKSLVKVKNGNFCVDTALNDFAKLCLEIPTEESREFLTFVIDIYKKNKPAMPSEKTFMKWKPLLAEIDFLEKEIQSKFHVQSSIHM